MSTACRAGRLNRPCPRWCRQDACKSRCGLRPAPLSYAAKCHYALGGDGREKHAVQDVREAGKDLRWEMSEADIGDGTRLLEGLRLVSRPGSSANR